MKYILIILFFILNGCAANKETKIITIKKSFAPQIWSDHKLFKGSLEMCSSKGKSILESLTFNKIVKNGHFVYGNFSNNRAVIKCVSIPEGTFVYTAVAGPNVKVVEKLRNEIMWQL